MWEWYQSPYLSLSMEANTCIPKDVNYDFNIEENTDFMVFLHVTAQASFTGGKGLRSILRV